jgi:hypothetical protein
MKKIVLISIFICSFYLSAQNEIFPMKGDYIYYKFSEKTDNKKNCIRLYSSLINSKGEYNTSAEEFLSNVSEKCLNLNSMKFTLIGVKNTQVSFIPPIAHDSYFSCTGDIKSEGEAFTLSLPLEIQFLEQNLLFKLLNSDKFKVSSQEITASLKLEFDSENSYSLIFTNFKIIYGGMQGNTSKNEVLNLETILNTLQEKGNLDDKMYANEMQSIQELDKIIKQCAKIYSDELKRTYEIDEL